MTYLVVFEGTGEENSNTRGVRTITGYENEEHFNQTLLDGSNKDVVVKAGVTPEEASHIASETPFESHIMAAFESSMSGNGHINQAVLEMKLITLAFMHSLDDDDAEKRPRLK